MSYKCNVPIVDPYGFAIRTYEVEAVYHEAEISYEAGKVESYPAFAEVIAVRVYDKAEPLVSEDPGEVDILDDLSDGTVAYLESKALESAPERVARRTMPDKDDDLARRIFDPILESIQRYHRPAEIAGRRDD